MSEENNTPNDELAAEALEGDPGMDALDDLETQLETARAEAVANLDGWQRAQAEFSNYKKRQELQRAQLTEEAVARAAKRYLEVLDDMERALANRPTSGDGAEWAAGIELVARKIQAILESEGVRITDPLGEPFDPNLHEAISQVESDEHESGTILEVLAKGYMIGERVLRPALVRVAA